MPSGSNPRSSSAFLVSKRGIEIAPKQFIGILQMQPPKTKKKIQALTRKLASLNRFISIYLDCLRPFFKDLKDASSWEWGPKCDRALQDIKYYLASLLILSQPIKREELYLYLAASTATVSLALVRVGSDGRQRPVYFVRKMLTDAETQYTDFE